MMMMMSASLGRGAGGRAQRATGSSTTAPRFNNCVEGLRRAFSLTFRAGGMVLFIPWRVAAARRAGSHRPARAGSHRPARAGWAALRRLADVAAFFLSESGSGRRWRRRWCGRRCRASSATGSPCATPRSQQHGKGRQQRFRFARNLHFANDLARFIYDADAGLLDRNVQSSKMVHAALLLLMLEAVHTNLVFTISLKRSTQNLQLSTSWPADYPIYCSDRYQNAVARQTSKGAISRQPAMLLEQRPSAHFNIRDYLNDGCQLHRLRS